MYFSKDNQSFIGVPETRFTNAVEIAAGRLKLVRGDKIYYKERQEQEPLIMIYRGRV